MIQPPSETAPGQCGGYYNQTSLSFSGGYAAAYGLPAGHWRSRMITGNGWTETYYDALWRPVVRQTYDNANPGGTLSQTVTRYDALGRVAFASYPQRTQNTGIATTWANPAVSPNALGIHTQYDALGRVTSVHQDAEPGVSVTTTTRYLSGPRTQVTNPNGNTTTTSYMAFDQPTLDWPSHIDAPDQLEITDIARDIFGKPASIKRRNISGGQSVTRRYVYNPYGQTLCKTIEPETGATLMDYDGVNNLIRSASGTTLTDPYNCNTANMAATGRLATRTYDARNRLTALYFPDGDGNQRWTYAADGLPTRVITDNLVTATGPSRTVTRTYAYNHRRLLTGESMALEGWVSYSAGYGYDGNAHLSTQAYPSGQIVYYAPNALGQPSAVTAAGQTYASNVAWYPNGTLSSFTYGNGVPYRMTQNARQLPSRVESVGVQGYDYQYDANANPLAIYDLTLGDNYSRVMDYDAIDRLETVSSISFGGDMAYRYRYTALGNVFSARLGEVKDYANLIYQTSSNRLTSITNSAGATVLSFGYDPQGNLTRKNGLAFTFDYGNRLRESKIDSLTYERYRYDGYGRRVFQGNATRDASQVGNIFSVYAQNGQLLYQENNHPAVAKATDNIYLGGSLIAQRNRPLYSGGATTIAYQHTDALGSPVAITNASRSVTERFRYEPYGARLGGIIKDGPGYTGHVLDTATGLNYMQQRYYDPAVGRFVSVDPVRVASYAGNNFNRYAYAQNSPIRYTDPFGLYVCSGPDEKCAEVRTYYNGIRDSQNAFDKSSSQYKAIGSVLSYLGKPGEKNGVIVKITKLDPGNVADNDHDTIHLDTDQVRSIGGKYAKFSSSAKSSDVIAALGSAALGHEGQHGVDAHEAGKGWPINKSQDRTTEVNAYRTESYISRASRIYTGTWAPAGTTGELDARLNRAVEGSVQAWCSAGGDCR